MQDLPYNGRNWSIFKLHAAPRVDPVTIGLHSSLILALKGVESWHFSRVCVFPAVSRLAALIAGLAAPIAVSVPAHAQGWGGWHGGGYGGGWHGGGYGYGGGGWHGGYYGPGPGVAVASGLLGLAVGAAVGSALAPPVYAAPPPVYYAAPPVIYAAPPAGLLRAAAAAGLLPPAIGDWRH